jgi:hypothetical protein
MKRATRSAVARWNVMTEALPRRVVARAPGSRSLPDGALNEDQVGDRDIVVLVDISASEANAPLGMRIAIGGMCSNASGIESSRILRRCASDYSNQVLTQAEAYADVSGDVRSS